MDSSPDFIAVKDGKGRWELANKAGLAIFGLAGKPYAGKTDLELARMTPPEFAASLEYCAVSDEEAWLARELSQSVETVPTLNNGALHFDVVKIPLYNSDGSRNKLVVIGRNVTALVQARTEEKLAGHIFTHSHEAIVVTDPEGHIVRVNPTFTELTGYSEQEVMGENLKVLSPCRQDNEFYRGIWRTLAAEGHWHGEVSNCRKNGEKYTTWLNISSVVDEQGRITHCVGAFTDISQHKAALETIRFLSHHDPLTQLPNRVLLRDLYERAAALSAGSGHHVALLFMDLDNFKEINDTLGHVTGDQLLQEVAARLRSCVRDGDTLSRIGGDEFVLLLPDIPDIGIAQATSEKVLQRLSDNICVGKHRLHTSCSIGISVYPEDGADFDTLLKKADTAMYHAKNGGRNAYRFYTGHMNDNAVERLRMQAHLRQAIERHELHLHYQPQFDLETGGLIGAEALIRWNNAEMGNVQPGKFIPFAEQSGLIIPIGEWVVHEACRQARTWLNDGHEPITIAVNLSAVQFRRPDIVESLLNAARSHDIDPRHIELELTESVLLYDVQSAIDIIRRLRDHGFRLSIDDFGTGFSSLAYLKHFKVDRLKIDRSFIRNLSIDNSDAAIVRSVISLGHSFQSRVMAEGVETRAQLDFLLNEGCDEVQGYLAGKPVPAAKFRFDAMMQTA